MKNYRIALVLLLCILLCGCEKYSSREGVGFPFSSDDVVSIDAYFYAGYPTSAQKKTVTDAETIQYLHSVFNSLKLKTGPIEYKSGAYVSSYRFHLEDGSTFELIYEGNGVKNGILSARDMAPQFTTADVNSLWHNLSETAASCPADEPPPLLREVPVEEAAAEITEDAND